MFYKDDRSVIAKNLIDNIHTCEDDSIDMQIYKLISAYVYRSATMVKALRTDDKVQDLISTAYVDFLDNFKDKYDSSKGLLSTYIFKVLGYRCPVYFYMTLYNVSFNTARKCIRSFKSEDIKQRLHMMYGSVESLSVNFDSTNTEMYDNNDKLMKVNQAAMSDPHDYIEELLDSISDELLHDLFNKILDDYASKKHKKDMVKDVVIKYTFGDEYNTKMTLEEIGQEYGVTRERIRQIVSRFYEFAKHSKRLKEYFDSDYIDRLNNERKEQYGEL